MHQSQAEAVYLAAVALIQEAVDLLSEVIPVDKAGAVACKIAADYSVSADRDSSDRRLPQRDCALMINMHKRVPLDDATRTVDLFGVAFTMQRHSPNHVFVTLEEPGKTTSLLINTQSDPIEVARSIMQMIASHNLMRVTIDEGV